MAEKFTTSSFEKEVLSSDLPVLVDFWASWCGPCRMLAPVIDELAAEADGYRVGKVNVDEEPELAERYGAQVTGVDDLNPRSSPSKTARPQRNPSASSQRPPCSSCWTKARPYRRAVSGR